MSSMTSAQAEHQLTALADQFAHWRQQRTYRFAPIPLPLWEQAIALTAVLPLASVAKRLGVRGRDLHKRCAASCSGLQSKRTGTAISAFSGPNYLHLSP